MLQRRWVEQEVSWIDDQDSAVRVENQEVVIARDYTIRLTTQCKLQELVVILISTVGNPLCNLNQLRFLEQSDQEAHSSLFPQVFVELLATEHLSKFKQNRCRN